MCCWFCILHSNHSVLQIGQRTKKKKDKKTSSDKMRSGCNELVACKTKSGDEKSKTLMECENFRSDARRVIPLTLSPPANRLPDSRFRLSTMPSPSSTHWTRTHTKIQHSSCSSWETTSHYGLQTHRVMETSHQQATRTNQTKFQTWNSRWETVRQQLSTKNKKQKQKFAQRSEIVDTRDDLTHKSYSFREFW